MTATTGKVKLISADNETVEIDIDTARMSQLLSSMIECKCVSLFVCVGQEKGKCVGGCRNLVFFIQVVTTVVTAKRFLKPHIRLCSAYSFCN